MTVSSALQLAAALAAARPGDSISLAPGDYGDVGIQGRSFPAAVTVSSADPSNPARLRSLLLTGCAGLVFDGLAVTLTPTVTMAVWQPAVAFRSCSRVTFRDGSISGGDALPNDYPNTYGQPGFPTGLGVQTLGCTDIRVEGTAITGLAKGFGLGSSSRILVLNNNIRGLRQSGFSSGGLSDVLIQGNRIADSRPWNWTVPGGDHADFIHLWTDPAWGVSRNIRIVGNFLDQAGGAPILGINLESHGPVFEGCSILDNALILADGQGMRLDAFTNGVVASNVAIPPPGSTIRPGLLFAGQLGAGNQVHDNIMGSFVDQGPGTGNVYARNYTDEVTVPGSPLYLSPDAVTAIQAAVDAYEARAIVLASLPAAQRGASWLGNAAAVPAALDALDPATGILIINDSQTVMIPASKAGHPLLGRLANSDGSAVTVTVRDGGAALAAGIDAVGALANLWHVQASDLAPITITADQFIRCAGALRKISGRSGGIRLMDSGANIRARLVELCGIVSSDAGPRFQTAIAVGGVPDWTQAERINCRVVVQTVIAG